MNDPATILPTSDGHHDRADMVMVWRAVQKGWKIPDEWKDTLPTVAAKIAADPSKSDRDRLRALELLNKLDDANFAKLLEAAKRNDDGEEKSTIRVVFEDRLKGHTHDQQRDRLPAAETGTGRAADL